MTNNINGIDVSEYFIDVVDEGGSTIDYKILPNSERLLVEKIFEQNQQLKRLQEENEELKEKIKSEKYIKENALQEATKYSMKCGEFRQALEEIKEIAKYNQFYNPKYFMLRGDIGQIQNIKMTEIYEKFNEVLND